MHADRWFWDLGHGATPAGMWRVKVWVAVVTEPGLQRARNCCRARIFANGAIMASRADGFVKPASTRTSTRSGLELIATAPGDAIVFNDRLLHGGGDSRGRLTRVSFELTMFVVR